MTDTDRALAVIDQRIGGLGQHAGKILIEQNAVIAGRGSHTIRIGYKQGVGRVRQSTGAAENRVTGIGILRGKGWLSDDQPGGLPPGKIGRAHGGRVKQKYSDAFHWYDSLDP